MGRRSGRKTLRTQARLSSLMEYPIRVACMIRQWGFKGHQSLNNIVLRYVLKIWMLVQGGASGSPEWLVGVGEPGPVRLGVGSRYVSIKQQVKSPHYTLSRFGACTYNAIK